MENFVYCTEMTRENECKFQRCMSPSVGSETELEDLSGGDMTTVLERTSNGESQSMEMRPGRAQTASLWELSLSTLALPFQPSSWSWCQWLVRADRKTRLEPRSTKWPGTFGQGCQASPQNFQPKMELNVTIPSINPTSVWSVYGQEPTSPSVPSRFSANLRIYNFNTNKNKLKI